MHKSHNPIPQHTHAPSPTQPMSSLPIHAIRSFHAGERRLFSRLAFDLELDPSLSLLLVAFWLWLEEDTSPDVIHRVASMSDASLRSAALAALPFLDTVLAPFSSSPASVSLREKAMDRIVYYLSRVCCMALADLHQKAVAHAHAWRRTKQPLIVHGCNALQLLDGMPDREPQLSSSRSEAFNMEFRKHSSVPREERTLFVTFSDGYPLTEEELHSFFTRHFGDVEMVNVEQAVGPRQPLFAHVSFYSIATVLRILNGGSKVKFMANGKHLWARRFIPKRKHEFAND
ncbi:hypothetical protein HPP92_002723 [Vanilla planifolia]|uniref:RRM domain-containing protein n=1 Tax=Vanilla planifolia TaxID=51239 RepID=A0A835S6W2_VANPL|nr:hypothetical protein HPP92_002723 [Vanilla planifolia]